MRSFKPTEKNKQTKEMKKENYNKDDKRQTTKMVNEKVGDKYNKKRSKQVKDRKYDYGTTKPI